MTSARPSITWIHIGDLHMNEADGFERRCGPVTLGRDIHAIGPWTERGMEGTQLGPDKNGMHW